MDRRSLLASALVALGSATSRAQAANARLEREEVRALVRDAYRFFLPLLEICRTRDHTLAEGPSNSFRHRRNLQGPSDRRVTTPNTDTLYSTGFLDLRQGPVKLAFPATGRRYFSLALMDAWSNNFHVAGSRTDGGHGGEMLIATAAQAATLRPPAGTQLVISPTRWVWALARILTTGGADLSAARAIQDALVVSGRTGPAPPMAPPRGSDLAALIRGLRPLAIDAGVLKADEPALRSFARRARAASVSLDPASVGPDVLAIGQPALVEARKHLAGAAEHWPEIGGWTYPKADIGDFGTDYAYRAEVAVALLAALPIKEAMYMSAVGPGVPGAPPRTFDGRKAWRLDLPPLPLQRDGFWSLSLYEATPDGGFYFVENPLERYAIGDRTQGLVKGPNGGVSIRIGAADPGGGAHANWLPAPQGPFALVLRAFLPGAPLLDGRFRLPPVTSA